MDLTKNIFVFGDQATHFVPDLELLLNTKGNVVLSSFLERVTYALRTEIGRVPGPQLEILPRFDTLLDLLAEAKTSELNPALELALLCITQLGCFISCHTDGSRSYPDSGRSYALGLCTGSFAAAAITTSKNTTELIPAAIEAVLVAFRTGLRAREARDDLECVVAAAPGVGSPVWALMVGLQEEQALRSLEIFSKGQSLPKSSRPFISAISATHVTIAGPSAVLLALTEHLAHGFYGSATEATTPPSIASLPIHAPFHAPHIYDQHDVENILAPSNSSILDSYASRFPLISSSTGKIISESSYRALLGRALRDVLMAPLQWDAVLRESAGTFASFATIDIWPILTKVQSLATTLGKKSLVEVQSIATVTAVSGEGNAMYFLDFNTHGIPGKSKIAIIGYGGRFPDAASPEKLWEDVLRPGRDVHREIPGDRFDVDAHFDPTGRQKNTSRIRHGCFIEEPGLFDARFFNMSPREAANSDPGQRLAITTAYEALEMAGFIPDSTPFSQRNRVGIFYGMTSDDWREVNSGQDVDTYYIPGSNRALTPGRINYHFKFSGPSFSVDTACSSSFAAIHTACNSLWRNDCDIAIAGGTNVLTNPDCFAGLDRGHFLSSTGNCNTFDDSADGYCRADAVATVVLKRLEDAVADNDPIKAVIVGACTNHSAEADSITRPHVGAQAFVFNKLLNEAAVDPLDVSYIEMHGTGTQAGDAVEMASVLNVFAKAKRGPEHPLYLGSAKANVGHAESASGVTSLVKVMKMLEKNEIPPHCGIKTKINHNFPTDMTDRDVHIALRPTPWRRPEYGNKKRLVFLNNFSAAGGNTALLLEDAPVRSSAYQSKDRNYQLVAVSGKSKLSLRKNLQALITFLVGNPKTSVQSLAYTTTARHLHHSHRVVVHGYELDSIIEGLKGKLSLCEEIKPVPVATKLPRVNFVFTGQGALYTRLAYALYKSNTRFRISLQRFDQIARKQGNPGFLGLIDGTIHTLDGVGPAITQVALTCVQIALAQLWMSWGVSPYAVVGHSLGEYAALQISSVLSANDAVFLVGTRARLLEDRCTAGTHCMLATNASLQTLGPYITGTTCEVACINGPNDTVLSGLIEEISPIAEALSVARIRCSKLDLPFAFHSSQVEAILPEFEAAAKSVSFNRPLIPFLSPLLGEVVTKSNILRPSYLSRASRESVNFRGALATAQDAGITSARDMWLEIGPHPVCSNMVKAILGPETFTIASLRRSCDDMKVIGESISDLHLAGINIRWSEYYYNSKDTDEVLQLPSYQWDTKNHWIQYRNNFCLAKGDPATDQEARKPEPEVASFSTSAIQRVIEQHIGKEKSTIVTESDVYEPSLFPTFQGHMVNGTPICTSSLLADIALTIADYLSHTSGQDSSDSFMNVSHMIVAKSLIAAGNGPQLFRASAVADWSTKSVGLEIYSVNAVGEKTEEHAKCAVKFESREGWLTDWKRTTYLIKSRMDLLERGTSEGQSDHINRGLAYKLFGAIVEYGMCYQGMQHVILNSGQLEATALVKFQTTEKEENHFISPYWIDSLGSIAGFIMNANDTTNSKTQVFINRGWDSMRCSTRFSREKTYRTYNKMQNVEGSLFVGDTYVFDEEEIVAVFGGVKFQGIPRQILDRLLPGLKAPKMAPKSSARSTNKTQERKRGDAVTSSYSVPRERNPVKTTPRATTPNESSMIGRLVTIIAEEVGVDKSELTPEASFVDMGIDSLLSLNIAGRLHELGLDLESHTLADFATVADLTKYLSSTNVPPSNHQYDTPKLVKSDSSSSSADAVDTDPTDLGEEDLDITGIVRRTIAEEVGVKEDEIDGTLDLAELGLDSLMALTILGKLRDEMDIDLPSGIFADHSTLNSLGDALGFNLKPAVSSNETRRDLSSNKTGRTNIIVPRASSVLSQGNGKSESKTLFLFPDGSGSATSYAPLGRISAGIAVVGLNCPFIKTPENLKCSVEDITPAYLAEIRRRQPHGPYYLGGWSAGGICAFDAAQELERCGERVERLILIDSPNPIGLEKLPPRLYDFFETIGLFGDGNNPPPKWLLPHFLAFVDSLDKYRPVPFKPGRAPQTYIIWARDGVCKFPESPRPDWTEGATREMKWLLNNRTDFGPNSWDKLIEAEKLVIKTLDDANHFSMMTRGKAQELATLIKAAMV